MAAFVLASNGLLYRNPILRGAGWFVVFDAEDEPELVLASCGENGETLDATQARLRAVSILEQSGLSAMVEGSPRKMMRAYTEDGDARDSFCFWLNVQEPIPADILPPGAVGVVEPEGDALVVSFGQPWGEPASEPAV